MVVGLFDEDKVKHEFSELGHIFKTHHVVSLGGPDESRLVIEASLDSHRLHSLITTASTFNDISLLDPLFGPDE